MFLPILRIYPKLGHQRLPGRTESPIVFAMANIQPATRPARSAARSSSISNPIPATSSPLTPGRVIRPPAPTPRKAPAPAPPPPRAAGRTSLPDQPPSASESHSPERSSSRDSYHAALNKETEEKEAVSNGHAQDAPNTVVLINLWCLCSLAPAQGSRIRRRDCRSQSAPRNPECCTNRR